MAARLSIFAFVALACVGCAPEIGDACESALDCSAQASRLCDRTQPGGYCTIRGCERATCPEEAICVTFRPQKARLAASYCMYRCEDDGDCREESGYACLAADEFGDGEEAVSLDGPNKRFCALPESGGAPQAVPDGGADAGADAGRDDQDAGADAGRGDQDAGRDDQDAGS